MRWLARWGGSGRSGRSGGSAPGSPLVSQTTRPLMTRPVAPVAWTWRWWWPQSRPALSRSEGPPCFQWMRWWALVQETGAVQPGQVQPRSRSARAMRCLGVKSRRVRPTSRGLAAGVDQHGHDLGAAQHPGEQVAGDRGAVVQLGRWGSGCTPVVVGLGGGTQRALGRLLARARLTSAAGHTATRPRRLGCCGGEALGGHADDHAHGATVGGRDVVPGQGGLGEVLQGVVAALAGGAWVQGAVLGR